jgi:hypothetical protein
MMTMACSCFDDLHDRWDPLDPGDFLQGGNGVATASSGLTAPNRAKR